MIQETYIFVEYTCYDSGSLYTNLDKDTFMAELSVSQLGLHVNVRHLPCVQIKVWSATGERSIWQSHCRLCVDDVRDNDASLCTFKHYSLFRWYAKWQNYRHINSFDNQEVTVYAVNSVVGIVENSCAANSFFDSQ